MRDAETEQEHRDRDPARVTLDRLREMDDVCGSEAPLAMDCWCTREPGHDGDCVCWICEERYGAPGWTREVG